MKLEVPFKHTEDDFIRHLWIREGSREVNMYLLIFTCFSVRALHIEVMLDMGVLSFLQAFVHFTNLYRIPAPIYSDKRIVLSDQLRLNKEVMLCKFTP